MIYILTFTILLSGMLGVSIGYHRYLAHKSFEPQTWFKILIVFLGLPAGTPVQWAGNHRAHHRFHDTKNDPHSPHFGGFWWAHTGWYLGTKNSVVCFLYAIAGPLRTVFDAFYRPRTNQTYIHYAKDISADPILSWMSRSSVYTILVLTHTLGFLSLVFIFTGIKGLIIAYFCYVYVYNVGDGVDSIGHMIGKSNIHSKHHAKNNWILGLLAFGDGWHGNHHDKPSLVRHGRGWKQIDLSYITLKFLSYFGVVKNLKI